MVIGLLRLRTQMTEPAAAVESSITAGARSHARLRLPDERGAGAGVATGPGVGRAGAAAAVTASVGGTGTGTAAGNVYEKRAFPAVGPDPTARSRTRSRTSGAIGLLKVMTY